MSAITLNNRVTTHSGSDVAFASCAALPIHQTTLNAEEMAGIDGLWDWGDFVSTVGFYAITTAVGGAGGGAVIGAVVTSPSGPGAALGAALGAAKGFVGGFVAGALAGATAYAWEEFIPDNS